MEAREIKVHRIERRVKSRGEQEYFANRKYDYSSGSRLKCAALLAPDDLYDRG